VLDLSKVEAGQVELEVATFSLREALERGVVMVREPAVKTASDCRSSSRPTSTWSTATSGACVRWSTTCSRTPSIHAGGGASSSRRRG
jgi:signal transduction histidine kinase